MGEGDPYTIHDTSENRTAIWCGTDSTLTVDELHKWWLPQNSTPAEGSRKSLHAARCGLHQVGVENLTCTGDPLGAVGPEETNALQGHHRRIAIT